jgi:hypothetical protein
MRIDSLSVIAEFTQIADQATGSAPHVEERHSLCHLEMTDDVKVSVALPVDQKG